MNIDGSTVLALSLIGVVAFVAIYVWLALALAAVFRKSGEQAWQAWVPILNTVVLLRLGGLSGWLLLLALVPFAGPVAVWVVVVIACHRIGRSFGYGPGMTVLAALLLPVWATIVGFGAARWVGAEPAGGARRTASEPAVDGTGLPVLPDYTRPTATYAPIAPPPAYGRAQPPAQPPMPATGWTPPPLPTSPVPVAAAPAAASAPPPVPPLPAPAVPVAPADDADPWDALGLRSVDELTDEVTGALTGAPAPISAVPGAPSDQPVPDEIPAGPRRAAPVVDGTTDASPPVTRVPAAATAAPADEPWAPAPMSDPEAFPETSGPVSAIAGAPDAGAPRSARASVSSQHTRPEIPDDAIEQTIIASRRRTQWSLVPPAGATVPLAADVVLVGRRPVADPAYPGAQLVAIQDGTVSKTHARLELRDDCWYITDLDSTNGVLFATVLGTEVEATPGVEIEAGDRFLLGDAEVRLIRSDG